MKYLHKINLPTLMVLLLIGCNSTARQQITESSLMPVFSTKVPESVVSIALSPDNKVIYVAQISGEVLAWNIERKVSMPIDINCHSAPVHIKVHPNGTVACIATRDGNLELWDLRLSKRLYTLLGVDKFISSVRFSQTGNMIMATYQYGVKISRNGEYELGLNPILIWDTNNGKLVKRFDGHGETVADAVFSADGKYVFSASSEYSKNGLLQWKVNTGEIVKKFKGDMGGFVGVEVSQHDKLITAFRRNGRIVNWDVEMPDKPMKFHATKGPAWTFKTSSDGKIVAIGTGHVIVSSFSEKPLISIPSNNYVKIFDLEQRRKLASLSHKTTVKTIAFSSDGSTLASYTASDGVRVWILDYYLQ